MSKFFEETMQGLLEAVAIDKGEIPLIEKKGMTSPTFVVADMEKKLIDEIVQIRKEQNKSLWRKKKNTRLSKVQCLCLHHKVDATGFEPVMENKSIRCNVQ